MSIQIQYNLDPLLNRFPEALIYLIFGEKSNGKSYQVKHKAGINHYVETKEKKKAVESFVNTGMRFILMRRWQADLSTTWIEQYFADVDVEKITNGEYQFITVYRKKLFFGKLENEKIKRGEHIGYVVALSGEQHFSGASFLDCDRIIFEEFMERGSYLPNEPARLMIFYSTVDRKRGVTKMFLVGNTISRVCPYLTDWGLLNVIRNLKQGEMTKLDFVNDDTVVTIAIEYCKPSGGKKLAIGSASSMIDSGDWQTNPQPKLPKSKKCYKVLYRIGFQYMGFKFLGEYLQDDNDLLWFIYPYSGEFSKDLIVFSDVILPSRLWQKDIYNISIKNETLKKLLSTFKENCIFYSDDLTGTDFKNAIDFMIRK